MTIMIDLNPETERMLQKEAARHGQDATTFVKSLVEGFVEGQARAIAARPQTPPTWLQDVKPRASAKGANGLADIVGEWPGDETDEDVEDALERLS